MEAQDPHYEARVRGIFAKANFMTMLGVTLVDLGPGWCATELIVREDHLQQDGFVHAAVVAAIADHSAGGASATLCAATEFPLTVEYKINLLRPAIGERLRCRAEVLKAGRTLTVAESEVYAERDGAEKLVAKATVTLALVT